MLERLHRIRLLQLESAIEGPDTPLTPVPGDAGRDERAAKLRLVLARLDGLLELAGSAPAAADEGHDLEAGQVAAELDRIAPEIESLAARIDDLRDELAVMPRYLEPLRQLLPLVPEPAELDEQESACPPARHRRARPGHRGRRLVETLRESAATSSATASSWSDARRGRAVGCLVVVAHSDAPSRPRAARPRARRRSCPARRSSASRSAGRSRRWSARLRLPPSSAGANELRELLAPHRAAGGPLPLGSPPSSNSSRRWAHSARRARLRRRVLGARSTVPVLRREIVLRLGAGSSLEDLGDVSGPAPPLLMRNGGLVRPFEPLVRFLDLPRAGSVDPTLLMALFLPLMSG